MCDNTKGRLLGDPTFLGFASVKIYRVSFFRLHWNTGLPEIISKFLYYKFNIIQYQLIKYYLKICLNQNLLFGLTNTLRLYQLFLFFHFIFHFVFPFKWWQVPLSLIHIKIFFCSEVASVVFFWLWQSFSVDKTQKGQIRKVTSMEEVTLN